MNAKRKKLLESKLTVFMVYYQQAEVKNDLKRMDKIGGIIDELSEEITNLS